MDLRPALAIFTALAVMLAGAAVARLLSDPDADLMSAVAAAAALTQAIFAGIMMRGLEHARSQAEAAMASVAIVERTAERQLRAYVHVIETRLDIGEDGDGATVFLRIKNVGQTPAHGVVLVFSLIVARPRDLGKLTVMPHAMRGAEIVLGAGCEDTTTLKIADRAWRASAELMEAGTLVQALLCRVEYRDVFDRSRETGLGVHYVWGGTELVMGSDHGMTGGNYAT